MTLSIIIVNWNTTEYLLNCLAGIYSNPPKAEFEVIVVDNNSRDDVRSVQERFNQVRLIKCAYNYGFAVGNNIGFRRSRGRYVMTLNPDTMIGGSEVDQLVEVLDRDPTVGIAVPVLSGVPVYKKHYSFSTLFFRSSLADKFSVTAKKNKVQTEAFDVVFFAGTGYVCRRAALPPGKVFFEDYFLFGEEYFLCKYVVDKNWTIRVIPSAKLIHFKGVTFKSDPARLAMAARLGSALSAYIRQQHWGRTRALLASLWLGLEYSCRSLIVICASLFSRRIQDDMDILLAQYKSYVIGALSGFFGGEHVLRKLNKRAEAFFNGGSTPTYPPASYDV